MEISDKKPLCLKEGEAERSHTRRQAAQFDWFTVLDGPPTPIQERRGFV